MPVNKVYYDKISNNILKHRRTDLLSTNTSIKLKKINLSSKRTPVLIDVLMRIGNKK